MTSGKFELRKVFAARREGLAPECRAAADAAICAVLKDWRVFAAAPAVAAFSAFGAEPDLLPLARTKSWFLPRYAAERGAYTLVEVADADADLVRGRYGILEPRPELPELPESRWRELLVLVPAVACDRFGVRLGRGGGYYDRILEDPECRAAAVVYDCQLSAEALPREEHDRRMDWVVTENGVIECGNRNA